MRYVAPKDDKPARLELSRRNLETLLAKLDDPASVRTLTKQEDAVDGDEVIQVSAVEDDAHYSSRAPGEVYMPTSGERL